MVENGARPAVVVDPLILTLAVTAGAMVLFATELLPPDVTALAAAAALMVLGVLTPEEGFSGFSNEATVTVLSMFILATGVQRTGLVNVMAHWVLDAAKGSANKFFLLMVAFAGTVSAFVNNTPVVAIMIPLVVTVCGRLKRSPSRFLIPLSYAAMLGGTMTLIGTSTNVLGSALSDDLGYGPFSMFMFAKVGLPLFLVGGIYLLLVGRRALPERHEMGEVTERFRLREYVCEVVIQEGSPLIGQRVEVSDLKRRFDVDIVRIIRDRVAIDQPLVGIELALDDVLLIRASRDELLAIRDAEGVSILPEVSHGLPGESGETLLVEVIITPGSIVEGATLRESQFRQRYSAVVLAVKKRERLFLRRLGNLRLEHGDTLLLSGAPDTIEALKSNPDFIVAEELEVEKFRRSKLPAVLGILAGVVIAATFGWLPISVAALTGVVLLVVTGALKVHELHEAVRWDVVFLLAGVIPIGVAMQKTGAAQLIADTITSNTMAYPAYVSLAVFYVTTMLLTQIISNNAAVALMIPVAADAAASLGLNPITFLLAVTFSASMGFMTPIGYQTNLMVYAAGEYRFVDYLKIGLPLSIITAVMTVYLLTVFWPM